MKPLDGIKVLDFTTLLPGPLATLMLCDAGAEVIKIEKLGGEEMRNAEPKISNESVLFSMLNRGKKSIEVDLKNPNYLYANYPFNTRQTSLLGFRRAEARMSWVLRPACT